MPTHALAVVAFDQISAFHLTVPSLVFTQSQRFGVDLQLTVCSCDPGPLRTDAGVGLLVDAGLEALSTAHTIVVPSWRSVGETPPLALLDALRAAHARGACIVGLCLGAYVLAEAGLLDGRRATTHWACAEDFSRRYPRIEVDAEVLYVDEGQLLTSAGTVAGIDCCLHLLRREYGITIANSVARHVVAAPHRPGGQAQFIERPLPASTGDSRLSAVLDWVRAHLEAPHTLDSLAARALMSRRSFTRHFRQLTGTTVGEWLLNERLARAQHLLAATALPVEHIAQHAGFGTASSLRQHFGRAFGLSPAAWRQNFRHA